MAKLRMVTYDSGFLIVNSRASIQIALIFTLFIWFPLSCPSRQSQLTGSRSGVITLTVSIPSDLLLVCSHPINQGPGGQVMRSTSSLNKTDGLKSRGPDSMTPSVLVRFIAHGCLVPGRNALIPDADAYEAQPCESREDC